MFTKGHKLNVGKKYSKDRRDKISASLTGKKLSKEHIEKLRIAQTGSKKSVATRIKMAKAHSGDKTNFWKGGVSEKNRTERQQIMSTIEYKLWREGVFIRDDYTCVFCGQRGGDLEADHIKSFKDYPELRLALDNGRTLCVACHRAVHSCDC